MVIRQEQLRFFKDEFQERGFQGDRGRDDIEEKEVQKLGKMKMEIVIVDVKYRQWYKIDIFFYSQ